MATNLRRFPVSGEPGRTVLLDRGDIYYIEAEGDDSLIRTARRKRYPHVEPLKTVEGRLPSSPFFRIYLHFPLAIPARDLNTRFGPFACQPTYSDTDATILVEYRDYVPIGPREKAARVDAPCNQAIRAQLISSAY